MRKQLFKIAAVAALMLTLTSNAFADESSSGGLRIGFYGALPNGNMNAFAGGGSVGVLVDLGNNLELGLGLAYYNSSTERKTEANNTTTTTENGNSSWEIIPNVSYVIRKGDIIGWGAGLNFHLSSNKQTAKDANGTSTTTEPDGMDMRIFPNFFIKAEVAKNFVVGLKPGIIINMPGEVKSNNGQTTESTTQFALRTELFLAFYL